MRPALLAASVTVTALLAVTLSRDARA
jgi:hypothetical protein